MNRPFNPSLGVGVQLKWEISRKEVLLTQQRLIITSREKVRAWRGYISHWMCSHKYSLHKSHMDISNADWESKIVGHRGTVVSLLHRL